MNAYQAYATGAAASTTTTRTGIWLDSEGTLLPNQRQFGPSLRAPPFVPSRRTMISIPGFYKSKVGPSRPGANKSHGHAQETEVHQSEQRLKAPATNKETLNDPFQKSFEVFFTINPVPVGKDTLHTQPLAKKVLPRMKENLIFSLRRLMRRQMRVIQLSQQPQKEVSGPPQI